MRPCLDTQHKALVFRVFMYPLATVFSFCFPVLCHFTPLLCPPCFLLLRRRRRQVAVTCFFRNSSQFSYAAQVAAFTAVVIFTGSKTVLGANGEAVSLARIVNTVVGSVIYLIVDMLLGERASYSRVMDWSGKRFEGLVPIFADFFTGKTILG